MPKTIALIARHNTLGIEIVLKELVSALVEQGHTLYFEAETAQHIERDGVLATIEAMNVTQTSMWPWCWVVMAPCSALPVSLLHLISL
jgi:hypothetical protein